MIRLGLMVPSSNTVMEPDLQRGLAGRATVHTARMRLADPVTMEGELEMIDEHAPRAAADLGTLEPDLVVFGCTSAGSLRGKQEDERMRGRLSELTGAPVLGIMDSLSRALRRRGAGRISVLTPYEDRLNEFLVRGLEAEGFEVLAIAGLGQAHNVAIGRIPPEAIVEAAPSVVRPGADALVVACANFRALEVLSELEQVAGLPVVTSCSVVVEDVLEEIDRLTGVSQT
jgi:maleate isomerase